MDKIKANFAVDKHSLQVILNAIKFYLDQWPGGPPAEQQELVDIITELNKALLELTFVED